MARILPDVSAATGPWAQPRQRFFPKVESSSDKALKIMQAISGGVRTAADLYGLGADIYDRAKETPEEALARVQKEAYEQNLSTRQSELDSAEREAVGVPAAVKSRMEALERVRDGRGELARGYAGAQLQRDPATGLEFPTRADTSLYDKAAPRMSQLTPTEAQPAMPVDEVIGNWGEFKQRAPQYGISREWIERGDYGGLGPKAGETYMEVARRVNQAPPQPEATAAGSLAQAPADPLPVIDVVTMQKISPRLPPSTRARLRAMTKAAIEEGRATLPNREQLTRLQAESDSTPQKQEVLLRAISEIESRETARPIAEQLDELMAYEQFTTDDLVMLARQARTPEEAMQVARAADMALDVVPSSSLPGAMTDRGQDLAATIEARRKVLNAYKQRKPMSLKDMAKIRLDLAKANKAQAEADKLGRRGTNSPPTDDNKWRQAMRLAGVPRSRRRKLVEADKKGFIDRIRAGTFSELGSAEDAFAKIEAETGLNLRKYNLPEPDKVDPVKPEASPAMKGSVKRAAQHEKDLRKASTSARSAVRKLEALGVGTKVFPGVKNIPDISTSRPEDIVAFATSLLSENVAPAGESPPINPAMLGKIVNELISAVTTAEVARIELKRSTSEAAAASNPFSSAPGRVALPPVSTPHNPTLLKQLEEVFEQVPSPGAGQ